MTDSQTIAAYDARVADYAALTKRSAPGRALLNFITAVRPGGTVLDLGCGPGAASATMRDRGLNVDPVDASVEMVRAAKETFGLPARLANFDHIHGTAIYDGVWANFSLLHAPRSRFGVHLEHIARALLPDSPFHIAMKLGVGEARDTLGRLYTFYNQDELLVHLATAGFTVRDIRLGKEVGLAGTIDDWIAILAVVEPSPE